MHTEEMSKVMASLGFILNTVAAPHDLDQFMALLRPDGTTCLIDVPDSPHPSASIANLI